MSVKSFQSTAWNKKNWNNFQHRNAKKRSLFESILNINWVNLSYFRVFLSSFNFVWAYLYQFKSFKYSQTIVIIFCSVAPEPRLGSVLARAFGQKARLGSLSFSKSSCLKNSANTSFLKNFEKDHWQSTVLMRKFQFFLSTMAPEGHFQLKDWSKMLKICQKWLKYMLYYVFCNAC